MLVSKVTLRRRACLRLLTRDARRQASRRWTLTSRVSEPGSRVQCLLVRSRQHRPLRPDVRPPAACSPSYISSHRHLIYSRPSNKLGALKELIPVPSPHSLPVPFLPLRPSIPRCPGDGSWAGARRRRTSGHRARAVLRGSAGGASGSSKREKTERGEIDNVDSSWCRVARLTDVWLHLSSVDPQEATTGLRTPGWMI